MQHALWCRLGAGVLAEEVVLLRRRQAGVAVRRADHSELVRVRPEFFFEHEATLQCFARVLLGQHLVRLAFGQIEVADVPGFVVGELVVGRQERMRFAVTLDLGDLVQRLPLGALLDVAAIQGTTGVLLVDGKHDAVGEVAVVRERQDGAAGLRLVVLHPLVEVERIGAADGSLRRVGNHQAGLVGTVTKDDIAVKVVSFDERGPLETNECRESVRFVVGIGRLDHIGPHRGVDL